LRGWRAGLLAAASLAAALPAGAEPMFLSRQYARCTTCHYSPTGGGLLTPYGRSLSREELSTWKGGTHATAAPGPGSAGSTGEESFFWGAFGGALHGVGAGIDLRPAHLEVHLPGAKETRDFLMNADLTLAYQAKGWTLYGQIGRQPRASGHDVASYEHWIGYQSAKGLGFRAGRFFPAYGIRLADHTAYTRAPLGFDTFDQLYAVELSHTGERHLAQVSLGPGYAESILHDDGRQAFTATGRFQFDLTPRTVLVASGLYRGQSDLDPRLTATGLAFGFAPLSRLAVWTEADAEFEQGSSGAPVYTVMNETSFEVVRGLWVKFSPQIRTAPGDTSGGSIRTAFELDFLPRTHFNLGLSYYRDRARVSDLVVKTFLAQLHLYL
jgi:hypothetical protein